MSIFNHDIYHPYFEHNCELCAQRKLKITKMEKYVSHEYLIFPDICTKSSSNKECLPISTIQILMNEPLPDEHKPIKIIIPNQKVRNKIPFSKEEDDIILTCRKQSRGWASISKSLIKRSINAVKLRYMELQPTTREYTSYETVLASKREYEKKLENHKQYIHKCELKRDELKVLVDAGRIELKCSLAAIDLKLVEMNRNVNQL